MKNYIIPEIEVLDISNNDVITASAGVESPKTDIGAGMTPDDFNFDW